MHRGGRGQRLCWGGSELVRCVLTAHIRSPACVIPAIVKTSALSRFGVTASPEAPAEWEAERVGGELALSPQEWPYWGQRWVKGQLRTLVS